MAGRLSSTKHLEEAGAFQLLLPGGWLSTFCLRGLAFHVLLPEGLLHQLMFPGGAGFPAHVSSGLTFQLLLPRGWLSSSCPSGRLSISCSPVSKGLTFQLLSAGVWFSGSMLSYLLLPGAGFAALASKELALRLLAQEVWHSSSSE